MLEEMEMEIDLAIYNEKEIKKDNKKISQTYTNPNKDT
jgi:hypothetical protein